MYTSVNFFVFVNEGLKVEALGIFFYVCFPGAYAKIDSGLQYLSPRHQLKILTAGILVNLLLAAVCYSVVVSLPGMVSVCLFDPVRGAVVVSISPSSAGMLCISYAITCDLEYIRYEVCA